MRTIAPKMTIPAPPSVPAGRLPANDVVAGPPRSRGTLPDGSPLPTFADAAGCDAYIRAA